MVAPRFERGGWGFESLRRYFDSVSEECERGGEKERRAAELFACPADHPPIFAPLDIARLRILAFRIGLVPMLHLRTLICIQYENEVIVCAFSLVLLVFDFL